MTDNGLQEAVKTLDLLHTRLALIEDYAQRGAGGQCPKAMCGRIDILAGDGMAKILEALRALKESGDV